MTESTPKGLLPPRVVTLPSGRAYVLRSIDPAKTVALLPPNALQMDQVAIKTLVVSQAVSDPEFLVALIRFLLSEGVESPSIVAKASIDDLGPSQIRFQDVGQDLLPLLQAIGAFNQQVDLLSLLAQR